MRKILFLILIVVACLPFRGRGQGPEQGPAQSESAAKAISVLRKLATTYQQSPFLSFDVQYRYAAEARPGEYLDSLSGQYKIHGSRYWSVLDNRESVFDSRLLLMVFNEDSIIYLAAPPDGGQGGALGMPDTSLLNNKSVVYSHASAPGEELVSMSFTGNVPYKKITWHVDRKTGYLTKMISVMQSDQLYDPSVRSLVTDAASSYVIVETLYGNYRLGTFDETVFNLGKYIKKEGKEYVTVAPYERYKVFLGSSGL